MLIKVKVHTGSDEQRIEKRAKDSYEVWVRELAKNGRANDALLSLLSEYFDRGVRIVKGSRRRNKIVRVY